MANQLRWKYWIFIFSIATLPAPEGCGFVLSLGFRTDTAKESSKRTCPRPLVQHHPKPKLWLKVLELWYDWKYAVTVGSWWLICTPTWCNLALPYLASAASTPLQGVMLQVPSAVMTGYRAALCASIYQFQTSVGNITNNSVCCLFRPLVLVVPSCAQETAYIQTGLSSWVAFKFNLHLCILHHHMKPGQYNLDSSA